MWTPNSHKPQLGHLLLSSLPLAYCYVQLITVIFLFLCLVVKALVWKVWTTLRALSPPLFFLFPINVTSLGSYWPTHEPPLFTFTVTSKWTSIDVEVQIWSVHPGLDFNIHRRRFLVRTCPDFNIHRDLDRPSFEPNIDVHEWFRFGPADIWTNHRHLCLQVCTA
jgi:hypothetical protein